MKISTAFSAATLLLCLGSFAYANPGTIVVRNSANHDAYVVVIDHNDSDKVALQRTRINSGTTKDVAVEIAGDGFAKVGWSTESADNASDVGGNASEEVADNGTLY